MHGRAVLAAMLSALLALAACSSSSSASSSSPAPSCVPARSPASAPASAAAVSKVLVIVEENHTLDQARAQMPCLMSHAREFAYATHYQAVAHPSLPNYLAITGGSTFGVTDDAGPGAHPVPGPSVFGQVLASGKAAAVYAESQPANCATDDEGEYAVRHSGWPYYPSERARCQANQVDLTALPAAIDAGLPTASLVVPNLCNDAHDCSLTTADNWLGTWLPRIEASQDFTAGRLAVVVTFDEGVGSDQTVLTVVLRQGLHGKVVAAPLTHYSLTGLIDDVAHVPHLRNATNAPSFKNAFGLIT